MNLGFETETVEFKKTTGELNEGVISLASMLNKNGYGTLYFGVKNNGDLIGQEIGDQTLRDISRAISNHIKPNIIPTISLKLYDSKNIIVVEVSGDETPYSAYGKYYIRSADEDKELLPNQLKKIMKKPNNSDEIINITANNQDLTFNLLKTNFITKDLTINDKTFKNNLNLLTPKGEYNQMAELLADKNDISIKVVTFNGTNKNEMIKRNEYGFKCLLVAMDQVLNYVESLNETRVKLTSHQREEQNLFDFSCFKEAWQNACLHNKWSTNNPPAVYIFSDRIEIISTGGLPEGLNKEEFYKGISRPVNEKLQKIFGQLGYVEQTGHGVPLITSKYGTKAIDIMENFINVTIPFTKEPKEKNDISKLNNSQLEVYKYLEKHPEATIDTLTEKCKISNGYVRKILTYLKKEGYLKRIGSNKNGRWEII